MSLCCYSGKTNKQILHLRTIVLCVVVSWFWLQICTKKPLLWVRYILPRHKIKCLASWRIYCLSLWYRRGKREEETVRWWAKFLAAVIQPWLEDGEQLNGSFHTSAQLYGIWKQCQPQKCTGCTPSLFLKTPSSTQNILATGDLVISQVRWIIEILFHRLT